MEKMMFYFDKEGDVLDISIGKPKEAISKEIGNDMLVRVDPKSQEVLGFTILNFEKRFKNKKPEEVYLPIAGHLKLEKA